MAKTQEELKELKNEYETLNSKLKELSKDELEQVMGGNGPSMGYTKCSIYICNKHDRCYLNEKQRVSIESMYSCSTCPKR